MTKPINLVLKAGERLFVNGAVLRFTRKTSVELLNDAVFLLEGHVLQADETTTPLRQIYFALQSMLIDPSMGEQAEKLAVTLVGSAQRVFSNAEILEGLDQVCLLVQSGRTFDAMKIVRRLYPIEEAIINDKPEVRAIRAA